MTTLLFANGAVRSASAICPDFLVAPTFSSTGAYPNAVVVGDFNSDGKIDLAVANGGSNNWPNKGPTSGGQSVTIRGINLAGATSVTFGGAAATITENTASSITVSSPSHAAGAVDVVVIAAAGGATSTLGYTYSATGVKGDANGDWQVTVADVFYLINNLFAAGQAPIGPCDVNGDREITVSDIFYLFNFLFTGGPPPR